MLGRGGTPMDISVYNWAVKLAKAYIETNLAAHGKQANGYQIGQTAKAMVAESDKWILLAQKKVLSTKRARTGGWRRHEPRA